KIPDPEANFWVRHRQSLLAQALADDEPVPPPQGEKVAAPGQQTRTVEIWDEVEKGVPRLAIKKVPEHLIPRDRPVFRPSEWSLILAQSYARYLCRTHGADKAEIIRHTQEAIPPGVLFGPEPPPGAFPVLTSNFGEYPK